MNLEWMSRALCTEVGSEIFFPARGGNPTRALSICRRCDVQQECLDYALELDTINGVPVLGIWGGTTGKDRDRMRGAARRRLAS